MRMSETPALVRTSGPALGEHSHAVLAEAGFAPDEIAEALAAPATAR
jgi:crotonobetainyl-CoA:carnitine CoA-transferase CaiB-like acyl-CoA transferase